MEKSTHTLHQIQLKYIFFARMETIQSLNSSDHVGTNLADEKDPSSYQYYIHFEQTDKRNDCWKMFKDLQPTSEKIKEKEESIQTSLHPNQNPHFGLSKADIALHDQITKIKSIERVRIGCYEAETWYYSPFPPQYQNLKILYICQFCLSFYCSAGQLERHDKCCSLFNPPGDQIYRNSGLSVFEVDGAKSITYCQNLGYISKLFLDHKNLKNQMTIFLFYVLCQIKDNEYHIVGYFSKVKDSTNNLSCILVFPFHQKKGYGRFLINFSYALSRVDGKVGGPEKPLSDLGRQTYLKIWIQRITQVLFHHQQKTISIETLSLKTLIPEEDIKWVVAKVNLMKYSKVSPESLKLMNNKKKGSMIVEDKIHYVPFKKSWQKESNLPKSLMKLRGKNQQ